MKCQTHKPTFSDGDWFSFSGWSPLVFGGDSPTCSQIVPDDIRRADGTGSLAELRTYWDLILDQTSLDLGFDTECLEGLDDLVLYSPTAAFDAVCWDQTIAPLSRVKRPPSLRLVHETSSYESEYDSGADTDEVETLKDETRISSIYSYLPSPPASPFGGSYPMIEPITLIKYSCLPYEISSSFLIFEPEHTLDYYSEDYVGSFPPGTAEHRKISKMNRIAAFCANLQSRLLNSN